MGPEDPPCYTLVASPADSDIYNDMQLRMDMEKGKLSSKRRALERTIYLLMSGERLGPSMLMTVIRFLLPVQDHGIKKLLFVFWEIVPKRNSDGKLLQEMILVCDAFRRDLQHPNEFIRGSTLRFLCKIRELELLEPLVPAIRACLEHKHSYVRRNAVLCIFAVYKNFHQLIPDAAELIAGFLDTELDASAKRNAFMILMKVDEERALNYLSAVIDQITSYSDQFQLIVIELIYRVCHRNPMERSRFLRCVYSLLNSTSAAVRYESAATLVSLSTAPSAVKASAEAYIELIVKEADNNVKLIVLDRLIALKENHERILQDLVMDVLRVLSASDMEVKRKTLELALELVSRKTIEDLVLVLRKEMNKTIRGADGEKYRELLVRTLHLGTLKFPDVAPTIIPVLLDFLTDSDETSALTVLAFVREVLHRFEERRPLIISRLLEMIPSIQGARVHRAALWILGEYCSTEEDIRWFVTTVKKALGDIPFVADADRQSDSLCNGDSQENHVDLPSSGDSVRTLVAADGTYASQSAYTVALSPRSKHPRTPLREYMISGDFFFSASMSSDLTKAAIKYSAIVQNRTKLHSLIAECMLIMASTISMGLSDHPEKKITVDDQHRIQQCIKVLSQLVRGEEDPCFLSETRGALTQLLALREKEEEWSKRKKKDSALNEVQADDAIVFVQLQPKGHHTQQENMFEVSLSQALGTIEGKQKAKDDLLSTSNLSKVTQLTGLSDPVYAEAYVHVNEYDITLDVLVVNQTADTLQNCSLELTTLGRLPGKRDLRLIDKPMPVVLAPHDFCNIKATVKVTATENGVIFGNIAYDVRGSTSDLNVVVLNDIRIDIMDYLVAANCSDEEFRKMWSELEWENKVSVNTSLTNLNEYLDHIVLSTNMRCLTPQKALSGDCGFLAANLYASSIFGEDALANVSIEVPQSCAQGSVVGHIRIRARTQGMALCLGDKINTVQKLVASRSTRKDVEL